ncbi:MAG: AAA family ATPase [Longimicrobiales bacterium]|nr:AAA family ATPase [Longimicrobiales bacterium]
MNEYVIVWALLGFVAGFWAARRGRPAQPGPTDRPEPRDPAQDEIPADDAGPGPLAESDVQRLYALADQLEANEANRFADPHDILDVPSFQAGVSILEDPDVSVERVTSYALGTNWVLGIMASEALARRPDSRTAVGRVLANIGQLAQWPLFFRLRFLAARADEPIIGRVLSSVGEWWSKEPVTVSAIDDFIAARLASGEELTFGDHLAELSPERLGHVDDLVRRLSEDHGALLLEELETHRAQMLDPEFVATAGRLWTEEIAGTPAFLSESLEARLDEMQAAFDPNELRSILLVGEPGVGKSTLRRVFSKQIVESGWRIFETSGTELLAGTRFVGDIETRVDQLRRNASVEKRVALYVDRLVELATAGKSVQRPVSVLDHLWPHVKGRQIFLVSEASPEAYQTLERRFPQLPSVMKVIRIPPATDDECKRLLTSLLERSDVEPYHGAVTDTLQLAGAYLAHQALPGRALDLLELALSRARTAREALSRDHLLGSLGELTGLPLEILDERQQLDVGALREEFRRRVIGQDEAVDCLVERVAMLKAGLTDAQRPIGVFLFAGPTGTGKTELAKTLAEILFGAADQMIRLDMSELQTSDALARLLGPPGRDHEPTSTSLVERIRQRPFSVLLLDEFEKAHPNVWDLFLQVFDDGRLTDRQGEVADFRHAIVILTSNLGATISNETGIGFVEKAGQFSSTEVMRAVSRTFRKEFVNRLDRVVIFKPLSREVMRLILRKELDDVLTRRGFRRKAWAVEWEDSALSFLLDKGFTPDLGARPLRRAIERHLLAPLSVTIVENRAPEGDQFLFVRSDGSRLQVEFVDPEAEPEPVHRRESTRAEGEGLTVAGMILQPTGDPAEEEFLARRVDRVVDRVEGRTWQETKNRGLLEMSEEGFWERDDRFDALGRIELMDRIESAVATVRSLMQRVDRSPGSASLVRRVAERLYVLEEGLADLDEGRPGLSFLGVRLLHEDADHSEGRYFLGRMVEMYRRWASRRGMQWVELSSLEQRPREAAIVSVAGFGSHAILSREVGLHVFEVPRGESRFDRISVRVAVAPQLVAPNLPPDKLLREARAALAEGQEAATTVVRRYRKRPSPLVRDGVGGWRTGRLEAIWEGDFDIWQ